MPGNEKHKEISTSHFFQFTANGVLLEIGATVLRRVAMDNKNVLDLLKQKMLMVEMDVQDLEMILDFAKQKIAQVRYIKYLHCA